MHSLLGDVLENSWCVQRGPWFVKRFLGDVVSNRDMEQPDAHFGRNIPAFHLSQSLSL